MKAVVMAGGEGTRLRPLTSNQPKPMVSIVGKPCMEHIVELLRDHGFEDVIVTVAFLPQAIRSYFGDGESLGINVEYSVEESPLGTAGSVRLAADKLDDTFLVISGDALCDFDLGKLVKFHKKRGAAVTIGLKSVENPLEFGIVVTDDDGRVERFLEKPSWGQVFSDTINTGVYVLEPEVLQHVPTDRPFDFSKELFPLLLEMGRPLYGLLDGRLLAGHREPRPVPAGELRRARRAGEADDPRHPTAGEHLAGGGGGARRPRPGRRACAHLELLPDRPRRSRRLALRPLVERHAPRGRPHGALGHRRLHAHRPRSPGRGRHRRPLLRHPGPRPPPGGRRDRRRGQDRRGERPHAGRAGLPVQGGRERRADLREPDLGVARVVAAVRARQRLRARERRPDARGRDQARGGLRNRASTRCPGGRQSGGIGVVPDDRARDDRRSQLDRGRARRPARHAQRRRTAPAEDPRLRRGLPRRFRRVRARPRADPLLRGARNPDRGRAPEGDREALHARRAASLGGDRSRQRRVSGAGEGELRRGPARDARPEGDPRPRVPHRRRLRLLGGVARAAARARPARRRGRLRARVRAARARRDDGEPAAG